MSTQFCHYRDHLCYISEEFEDDEVTLVLLAEEMVGGGYQKCDCAREQFVMVNVAQAERFKLTKPAQTTGPDKTHNSPSLQAEAPDTGAEAGK